MLLCSPFSWRNPFGRGTFRRLRVPQTFMILYRGVYVVSHLEESADRSCAPFSVLAPCSRGLAEVTMLRIVRQDPIIG